MTFWNVRAMTLVALLGLAAACAPAPAAPTTAPKPTVAAAKPTAAAAKPAAPAPASSPAAAASPAVPVASPAAASPYTGGPLIPVHIGYNVNGGQTPIFTALNRGIFKKHGLDVKTTTFAQNPQMVAAISNGSLDLMGSIPSYVWSAREAGYDLVSISQHEKSRTSPPESGALMVRVDGDIKTLKDLEGKRLAVLTPSSQNTLDSLYLAKKAGVDITKITLITAPFNTHFDLLKSNQVDAAAVVDPFQTQIEASGVGKVLQWAYYESVPEQPLAALWGAREWFDKNPEAVDRLHAAMAESIDLLNNNPAEARAILREFTNVPEDILAQMKVLNNWSYGINRQAWIKEAELLVEMGALKELPDPEKYFHPKAKKFFIN